MSYNVKYQPIFKPEGYPTDNLIKSLTDVELLAHMGVPRIYRDPVLTMTKRTLNPDIEKWISDMPTIHRGSGEMCGKGLILYGPARTGKTVIAATVLLRLVRMGIHNNDPDGRDRWDGWCMGKFVDWQDHSLLLRRGITDEVSEHQAYEQAKAMEVIGPKISNANFLVIDDISRERATGFNIDDLTRTIRKRGDWGYPTIITTNYLPGEWSDHYPEWLYGYMVDRFVSVQID